MAQASIADPGQAPVTTTTTTVAPAPTPKPSRGGRIAHLTIRLPKAVAAELRAGQAVKLTLTLVATDGGGTARARLALGRLR
jgi:hypothetical protein